MNAVQRAACKKAGATAILLLLSAWLFVPLASADFPGMGNGPSQAKIEKIKQSDAVYKFTAGLQTPPPIDSNCQSGKAEGQCMNDYCGTDVQDIVTACLSTEAATKNILQLKSKCWGGYNCTGAKGVCCVVPKEIAGECNNDYEGEDWGQVTFRCAVDADTCKNKYPGAIAMDGGYGCSSGICCKMGKSVAKLSQNSDKGSQAKIRRDIPINTFCFTAKECADASGDAANFKAGQGCTKRGAEVQGYCIAPEPDYDLQYPILGVKTVRGLKNFIALLFNTGIGIIIVTSAVFFIWGAFKYMVSAMGAEIANAKSTMIDSLIGLALGVGAYAILANVNPNTLNLKTFEIKMINRLSFYNLKYCEDIPQSALMKFMDAGPPDAPKDFQSQFSSEGYKLGLDQAKCGNEYFIEGSSATDVCMGAMCGLGKTCMSCSTGIVDDAQCKGLSTNRMNGCISKDKVQVFGRVLLGSTHTASTIQASLYCFKADGKLINDERTMDISDKEPIKIEKVNTANTSGSVGTFLINSMTEERIQKAIQECRAAGFDFGRVALLLDIERPGEGVTTRMILTKAHCNTNIGSSAQDSGAVLWYLPYGITQTCGQSIFTSIVFKDFGQTLASGSKCSKLFKANYIDNTWTTQEFIAAAKHERMIECPITAADMIQTVPNWLQNVAAVVGYKLPSGF